jgi:hypothetical protein
MKKITLIAALVLSATVYGQKGSWYLGGSAGASFREVKSEAAFKKTVSWNISPEVGTFLTDHLQLGFGIGYGNTTVSDNFSSKIKSYALGGSIHSRYLFGKRAFKPFLGLGIFYSAGKTPTFDYIENGYIISPGGNSDQQILNAGLTAGFFYDLSPRVSLFGSMNVLGYNETHTGGQVSRNLGFNASTLVSRFSVGMYYTLKKGKSAE